MIIAVLFKTATQVRGIEFSQIIILPHTAIEKVIVSQAVMEQVLRDFSVPGTGRLEARFSPLWDENGYPSVPEILMTLSSSLPSDVEFKIDAFLLCLGEVMAPFPLTVCTSNQTYAVPPHGVTSQDRLHYVLSQLQRDNYQHTLVTTQGIDIANYSLVSQVGEKDVRDHISSELLRKTVDTPDGAQWSRGADSGAEATNTGRLGRDQGAPEIPIRNTHCTWAFTSVADPQ